MFWSQRIERLIFVLLVALVCVVCFFFAYEIRLDFAVPMEERAQRIDELLWVVPLKMVLLYAFGFFDITITRFRLRDFYQLLFALCINAGFLVYAFYVFGSEKVPGRSVTAIDLMLSLFFLSALRIMVQHLRGQAYGLADGSGGTRANVGILHAGFLGMRLAQDLEGRPFFRIRPVAFIDDAPFKQGRSYGGLPVVGQLNDLERVIDRFELSEIVVSQPDLDREDLINLVDRLRAVNVRTSLVPPPYEILNGGVTLDDLQPPNIEDYLRRNEIGFDILGIRQVLQEKNILIVGAAGALGRSFVRLVATQSPCRLLLMDSSEGALQTLMQELRFRGMDSLAVPLLANICDEVRVQNIFAQYRPDIVFHTATCNHLSLLEQQPGEAIKTNVEGSLSLARVALQHGVQKFVSISSDKAADPTSVLGATLRAKEMMLEHTFAAENQSDGLGIFRQVNLLRRRGGIDALIQAQVDRGGPVTITDPESERYFMGAGECAVLFLQAQLLSEPSGIFWVDPGPPVNIAELARLIIDISGFRPDHDIKLSYTGLRPGEKLREKAVGNDEEGVRCEDQRFVRITTKNSATAHDVEEMSKLIAAFPSMNRNEIKLALREIVPTYRPFLD